MRQCFINVGLAPCAGTGTTEPKTCQVCGGLQSPAWYNGIRGKRGPCAGPAGAEVDQTCLGEVAAELQMVQREGVDSDFEGDDEVSSDEEEEEDDEES